MMSYLAAGSVLIAGSCLQGLTGFGYSLLCLPLLALFLPVRDAVPILIATSIILNILVWAGARRCVRLPALLPLMLAGLVGTPLGVWLLGVIDDWMLKAAIGILVILASLLYMTGFRVTIRRYRITMLAVGLLSGVLNGSTSLSGPPVILLLVNQDASRDTFLGSLSIYFLCLNLVAVPALIVGGLYSMEAVRMTIMGAPLVLAGGLLGTWLSRRMGDREFRKASLVFLALLGIVSLLLAVADVV
jgi:uncharacterized membrane protein YfcA